MYAHVPSTHHGVAGDARLVYGRYGRAGYGASVFYVFATVVHGLILTVAGVALFAAWMADVERHPNQIYSRH
jgi:hypothetical protein